VEPDQDEGQQGGQHNADDADGKTNFVQFLNVHVGDLVGIVIHERHLSETPAKVLIDKTG
jgi:hypothetical protein